MFTGLIQGKGRIDAIEARGNENRLRITAQYPLENIEFGESIATNGVCLTVETFGDRWFTAYASGETMKLTNLGNLRKGSTVNLERAMAMGERFGGHIVSGHVDCLGTVASITPAGQSNIYRISFPAEHGPMVVQKGSITLDGISLTVNDCGEDFLEVNIIPATQQETTIAQWKVGYQVNLETDIIGKYVQNMLNPYLQKGKKPAGNPKGSKLSMEFLREHGF
ncbi:MAG: riboflavin synthase [Desulfovibrio sp.]